MTLEKRKRIVSAITASAVLLLFLLIAVMVYQMVTINGKKAKIQSLNAQIEQLEKEQETLTDDIELWLSEWKIEERARELNYAYPEDE
jgi:cell division protein FtsB